MLPESIRAAAKSSRGADILMTASRVQHSNTEQTGQPFKGKLAGFSAACALLKRQKQTNII